MPLFLFLLAILFPSLWFAKGPVIFINIHCQQIANISSFLYTVMRQLQICSVNSSQRNTLLPFVNSWARFFEGLSGRKRMGAGGEGKPSVIALCRGWIVTNNGVPLLCELLLRIKRTVKLNGNRDKLKQHSVTWPRDRLRTQTNLRLSGTLQGAILYRLLFLRLCPSVLLCFVMSAERAGLGCECGGGRR